MRRRSTLDDERRRGRGSAHGNERDDRRADRRDDRRADQRSDRHPEKRNRQRGRVASDEGVIRPGRQRPTAAPPAGVAGSPGPGSPDLLSTLLERVRNAVRMHRYSAQTEKAYLSWVRRFVLFHHGRD